MDENAALSNLAPDDAAPSLLPPPAGVLQPANVEAIGSIGAPANSCRRWRRENAGWFGMRVDMSVEWICVNRASWHATCDGCVTAALNVRSSR